MSKELQTEDVMVDTFYFGVVLDLASVVFMVGMLAFLYMIAKEFWLGLKEE